MRPLKSKISFFLTSIFLISVSGLFLFNVIEAKADASFPQDTTVEFDMGNFTIVGGSGADEVTTNGGQITITISPGQRFTFKSSDRKLLTNDGGYSYTCSSTESSISITVPAGEAQKIVRITPDTLNCDTNTGSGGGGGGGGGGGAASSASASAPASPTVSTSAPTPAARGFVSLAALSLREGDVISAAGSDDPDVYIVNEHGYKRLFLNPVIFGFYGHLGGFAKVKSTVAPTRDTLVTSGLFRNCETNDEKIYGVETTGEDTGMLHWVNTTGAQAVADDPDFFKKVFCINNKEFNWYKKGTPYTSVNQIPSYTRTNIVGGQPAPATSGRIKVVSTVLWLNVRDGGSLSAKIIGQALPNQEFDFSAFINGWYKIQKDGKDFGWVFGQYVTKI